MWPIKLRPYDRQKLFNFKTRGLKIPTHGVNWVKKDDTTLLQFILQPQFSMCTQVMTKIFWGGRGRRTANSSWNKKKNILVTCKCERNSTLVDLHNSLRDHTQPIIQWLLITCWLLACYSTYFTVASFLSPTKGHVTQDHLSQLSL